MNDIEAITRKWGNSIGITLPKEFVEKENIHPDQKVLIHVTPITDLRSLRGLITKGKSSQQRKDEMRLGWS